MEMTSPTTKLTITAGGKNIQIDNGELKQTASVFRAINHGLRQSMLKMLDEQKRMNVTDIYTRLKLEQSVASQHLAILRRAGIVKTERESKEIYYSVNKPRLAHVEKIIEELVR